MKSTDHTQCISPSLGQDQGLGSFLNQSVNDVMAEGFSLFHPAFVGICEGSLSAGIFLSTAVSIQLDYERKGQYEWCCEISELQQRLMLGRCRVIDASRYLRDRGIITSARQGKPPRRYYAVNWEVFEPLWHEYTGQRFFG